MALSISLSTTISTTVRQIDQFTEFTGRSIAWLNVAMVVLTCLVVIMRYVFNHSSIVLQESAMYLHAMVFLIASAYTLKHDEHVRVDIFYQRLPTKGKALVNLIGTLFLLIPVILFIGWSSWPYIESSWRVLETSSEAAGLPLVFLLKSLILVMVAVLLIQALAEALRSIAELAGVHVDHDHRDEGTL